MSEGDFAAVIGDMLIIETHARFDHDFWCGSTREYRSCPKLAEHRAEGDEVLKRFKAEK